MIKQRIRRSSSGEKMSGWIRIWVVLSILWTLGVLVYLTPRLPETEKVVEGPWLKYRVDPRRLFISSSSDQFPVYTIVADFDDGTSSEIDNVPILWEGDIPDIEQKLEYLAKDRGTTISEESKQRTVRQAMALSDEARTIQRQYKEMVYQLKKDQSIGWWTGIFEMSIYIFVGPVSLLLLGYSVDWIRGGFK